jgi:hypothetical protein
MSIIITNCGPTNEGEAEEYGGERLYKVFINKTFICEFKHFRKDGLATCLQKAAEAIEKGDKSYVNYIIRLYGE